MAIKRTDITVEHIYNSISSLKFTDKILNAKWISFDSKEDSPLKKTTKEDINNSQTYGKVFRNEYAIPPRLILCRVKPVIPVFHQIIDVVFAGQSLLPFVNNHKSELNVLLFLAETDPKFKYNRYKDPNVKLLKLLQCLFMGWNSSIVKLTPEVRYITTLLWQGKIPTRLINVDNFNTLWAANKILKNI